MTLTTDVYIPRSQSQSGGQSAAHRYASARVRALNRDLQDCATGNKIPTEVVHRADNTYNLFPGQPANSALVPAHPTELDWAQGAHVFPLSQELRVRITILRRGAKIIFLSQWNGLGFNAQAALDNGYTYTLNHINNNNTAPVNMTPSGLNSIRNLTIFGATQHSGYDAHRWSVDVTVRNFCISRAPSVSNHSMRQQDNFRVIQLFSNRDNGLASHIFVQTLLANANTSVVAAYFDDHFRQACLKHVLAT